MRVLHLPTNIASQISASVRTLRRLGIDAHGLTIGNAITDPAGLAMYPGRGIRWTTAVLREIARADLLHWHFSSAFVRGNMDLRFARLLRKPSVVEFWGSDIRISEIEAADNPEYAKRGSKYEFEQMETREHSHARQRAFAASGARMCFAYHDAEKFLVPGLFQSVQRAWPRVVLDDYPLAEPSARHDRVPVVAHSPSRKGVKGTDAVLAAVEWVRAQGVAFEFLLMHDVHHDEALRRVASADVFVDQLVLGAYGLASVEAMALGKPVLCYIAPRLREAYPPELPVVAATGAGLGPALLELLVDAELRQRLGRAGRAYVERYHDAETHSRWLLSLYEALMSGATPASHVPYPPARPGEAPAARCGPLFGSGIAC